MILTPEHYRLMPWANGKGTTVEMLRLEGPRGVTLRLSRASVVEDGDFSIFPGIERNLTVLTGPGFELIGPGIQLAARPLLPVAFPGDVAVRAQGVTAPSEDFNVMTARALPRPQVSVLGAGDLARGEALILHALGPAAVEGHTLPDQALMIAFGQARVERGRLVAVALQGMDPDQWRKIG